MRRFGWALGAIMVAAVLWWIMGNRDGVTEQKERDGKKQAREIPGSKPVSAPAPVANSPTGPENEEPPYEGIEHLNAPERTIHQDLALLNEVFFSWQTNFPRQGNPVGGNDEITAALTGRNSLRLVMIPRTHPAINAKGELIDRWGTPFHFHQLSGSKMEIRSAGPDKELFSADDSVLTP